MPALRHPRLTADIVAVSGIAGIANNCAFHAQVDAAAIAQEHETTEAGSMDLPRALEMPTANSPSASCMQPLTPLHPASNKAAAGVAAASLPVAGGCPGVSGPNDAGTAPGLSLHDAAREGCLAAVQAQLLARADASATDDNGDAPLALAAERGHAAVIEALLAAGADAGAGDQAGATPLFWAAQEGQLAVVQSLLGVGVEVDAADEEGDTPLIMAASNGHAAVIKALLSSGADVGAADQNGCTPLIWAAQEGHAAAVEVLLAGGALVGAKNYAGMTAADCAAAEGHCTVLEVLAQKRRRMAE
jgi:ankyrin repeat protein